MNEQTNYVLTHMAAERGISSDQMKEIIKDAIHSSSNLTLRKEMGHCKTLWGTNRDLLCNPESDDEEKASDHSQGYLFFLSFRLDECML